MNRHHMFSLKESRRINIKIILQLAIPAFIFSAIFTYLNTIDISELFFIKSINALICDNALAVEVDNILKFFGAAYLAYLFSHLASRTTLALTNRNSLKAHYNKLQIIILLVLILIFSFALYAIEPDCHGFIFKTFTSAVLALIVSSKVSKKLHNV